jgi:hypothetical protein
VYSGSRGTLYKCVCLAGGGKGVQDWRSSSSSSGRKEEGTSEEEEDEGEARAR